VHDGEKSANSDCFRVATKGNNDEIIPCKVGGRTMEMVIDSGSKHNLCSQADWQKLIDDQATIFNMRTKSSNQFRSYASDQPLKILRVFEAPISVKRDPEVIATFYVIENSRQSLLGCDTAIQLNVLKLGLNINRVEQIGSFPKWKDVQIRLSIDPTVVPVKQPMRRVPTALEHKVNAKLEEALKFDIIEPVTGPSAWISPVVIVFKECGDIRMCLDMRRANKAIKRENYPLPTFDSLMTKLKNAKYFSRLDLKNAYHQLELDVASREITTFITHRGLFRYKRLLFGVNSAPEIFQRLMEEMLAQCPNAINYIDDVIVFGNTLEEHDMALSAVKDVFVGRNVMLNEEKCVWRTTKLKFLGHILSDKGIEADPGKIEIIQNFREPKNKEEVRSFLGLVTYVGKFIPDLADTTEPLRGLLKLNEKFIWGEAQKLAFKQLKEKVSVVPMLSYFTLTDRTKLIADASPVALGAVLVQLDKDKIPRIISFASKSLSEVEKRYSQTEKESLALVWAVEKFYFYLIGLEFDLVTDHKPLEAIFKPTSRPPARIERWLLRLQSYRFRVVYKPGKENIADSLSRLSQETESNSFDWQGEKNIFHIVSNSIPVSLSISEIAESSTHDEGIMDAMTCLKEDSWKLATSSPFYPFRFEVSTLGNLLLRGTKIVIPKNLRRKVLELAHEGHPGETAMKRRLRSKVWWPRMDREAEEFVKTCRSCILVSAPVRPAPMKRHSFPNGPWKCLATDLLGPLPNGEYILVLIDYYSRYMEYKITRSITSKTIINEMEEIFARLGFPQTLTADNGRQFISAEFKEFCTTNGIELRTTPPYWPQANGEVENMNKSLVKRLKIAYASRSNNKKELQKFVLMYNVTPHSTTGAAPTQLMYNRTIRDKIPGIEDILDQDVDSEERDKDMCQKEKGKKVADAARGAKDIQLTVGDRVLIKNVIIPHKLTPTFDPTVYEVTSRDGDVVQVTGNGKSYTRNASHLKKVESSAAVQPEKGQSPKRTDESFPAKPIDAELTSQMPQGGLKLRLKKKGEMWEPVSADRDSSPTLDT